MAASYVAAAHAEADQLGQPDFASSVASTSATSATSATSSGAMTFTVVAFSPSAVVPSPTQQFQLASLMTLPGSKFKWQPRRGFDRQALLDLSLSDLRQGMADVPPVYLNRFPADLAALRSAKKRKDIFIKTVLPLVLRANNEVRAERQRRPLCQRRNGHTLTSWQCSTASPQVIWMNCNGALMSCRHLWLWPRGRRNPVGAPPASPVRAMQCLASGLFARAVVWCR